MSAPAASDIQTALRRLREARGDELAWRALYAHLWPYVIAIAFRESGARAAVAEDAAQETFLRLVRYAPFADLQDPADLRAYAGTVARRVTRDLLARESRRPERSLGQDAAGGDVEPPARGPLGALLPEDALERAKAFLDEPQLALFRLLLEGADVTRVAETLGLSYGAAAVRIHRLRAELRKSL